MVSPTIKTKAVEDSDKGNKTEYKQVLFEKPNMFEGCCHPRDEWLHSAPISCLIIFCSQPKYCNNQISSAKETRCAENDPTSAEPDKNCVFQVQIIKLRHMVKTYFWAAFWQNPDQKILHSLYYAHRTDNMFQSNTHLAEQKICRRKNVSALIFLLKKNPTLTRFKYRLSKFMDCKKFHSSERRGY